jgi:outer membrane protein OmpA-like peptidoglycan-associated protein
MDLRRGLKAIGLISSIILVAGCNTFASSPPPPVVRPPAFTALGLSAAYLYSDVVGGHRARAAKMKAAKIRPLSATAAPAYMANLASELRRQTAGIGLDVLQVGNGIIVRIPAEFTFDQGSSTVKPQTDATLLEIARTVKTRSQTYVDVFAHTDTTGTAQVNEALSNKRAAAVASYLASHGVSRSRIASKGLGESAPLYNPEADETQKAANRRIEIRLTPYLG